MVELVESISVEVDEWTARLDGLFVRVAGVFSRVDLRRCAKDYMRGLLGPVERKNTWQIAEYAGHEGPYRFQNLLGRAVWDPERVCEQIRTYAFEHLGEDDGVLIFDETGFIKKGGASAGVARQYTGTSGKIDNCQIGVFAAYASRSGRALIDRELYLPKSWAGDGRRRAAAGVPETRRFLTKPELAVRMMTRILARDAPIAWVAADEVYGQDAKFRAACLHRNVGYVVAVPRSQHVPTARFGTRRIDTLAAQAPDEAWERISAGDGAKGPRLYDWATARIGAWWDEENQIGHWVLIRRSTTDPTDLAFYLCAGPAGTTIEQLVRVAGARWAIEECFQAAKMHTGLDHYEVRSYTGWYRHITLAMLAHAFLAVLAAAKGDPENTMPSTRLSPWARSGGSWQV
jgi:SRSO17 transposase